MTNIGTEAELVGCALALMGGNVSLSASERALVGRAVFSFDQRFLKGLKSTIRGGGDPLGDAFSQLRTPDYRRALGAIYTPRLFVDAMLGWAKEENPGRVVDPGAGSGRFLVAAGRLFPRAELVGIELDPLAALMLRANLAALDLSERSRVFVGDYCAVPLKRFSEKTLFIGNPPYVRHHLIDGAAKDWYARTALDYGVKASKLAGQHLYFFLRTLQLARKGDIGCFLTAAEWLDVNYGATLRQLLAGELGGSSLTLLDSARLVSPMLSQAASSPAFASASDRKRLQCVMLLISAI